MEYVGSVSDGLWSAGSAGKWANDWSDFAPNVLSLRDFSGLKILSQKCLFLKSLVFRELVGCTGRILKKLKKRGRERTREDERGKERKRRRDKETKRRRDEERKGEEDREEEREEDRGRQRKRGKDHLFET